MPGRAEVARLGLNGSVIDAGRARDVAAPAKLVAGAASLLAGEVSAAADGRTLAVGDHGDGVHRSGPLVHPVQQRPARPRRRAPHARCWPPPATDPAVLGNDMQALAARWLLTHRAEPRQDVLLVWFTDGRLGSALLVDGRPNRGSVTGGNELGHTRFPGVETDVVLLRPRPAAWSGSSARRSCTAWTTTSDHASDHADHQQSGAR